MLSYPEEANGSSAEPQPTENDGQTDVYYPARMAVPNSWYICGMTVFEQWRSRGLGTQFLAHASRLAEDRGYDRLSLIAFEQNVGSVRLYLRNGFEVLERRDIVPHPMIEYRGQVLLMAANTKEVQRLSELAGFPAC